jgi:hypothetical protein
LVKVSGTKRGGHDVVSKRFSDMTEAEIRGLDGQTWDEYAEVAEMIADHGGRSVIDADYELAARIIAHVRGERAPTMRRDPTYGWKPDERA